MKTARKTIAHRSGRKALLYVGTSPKKVLVTLGVATPDEIIRSLKLSKASMARVNRAVAMARLRSK